MQTLTHRMRYGVGSYFGNMTLIGLVIALLWGGIGLDLWHEHATAQKAAESDSTNLARAFDENITRTLEAIDLTLLFMRDFYQRDPSALANGALASGPPFMNDAHIQMALTDRDGNVFWSNLNTNVAGINVADREHFQKQRSDPDDNMVIGKPVVGRVSGRWSILFTRKLLSPDHSFAGIAVVSIDPHYLSRFYESISIGRGSIILGTTSGTILARVPEGNVSIGQEMPPGLMGRVRSGTVPSSYRTVSHLDHVERIYAARLLTRYPLVVSVGLATDDVFAPFERNSLIYCTIGVLISAAAVIIALILARQRQSVINSQQVLTATLEHMSQGIAMVDPTGNVRVLNQRAMDLFGLPRHLVATNPTFPQIVAWQRDQQHTEEQDAWDPSFTQAMLAADESTVNSTYERTGPNGIILEIRTEGLPDGGFVRTFTDITERKLNETALTAAHARATHAERIQVLGQLAGGIAHDFNNILQAVQGGAGLIEKRANAPDSVRQFAHMILDATERGTSITGRLLAFARRGEVRAEPLDARKLLTELREVLIHTLGSPIRIDLAVDQGPALLLADKGQLETVLINLATNARDAMPNGGSLTFRAVHEVVTTSLPAAPDLRPGHYIRLSIADTGFGMDEATLAQATQPFFSTKPQGEGTGLGLSMAKGFLDRNGGALSIDSAPGHGTTVHLWLPSAAEQRTAHAPDLPAPSAGKSCGKRILLVDDEAMVRQTLAASLEDIGYEVSLAASGSEALDILDASNSVDVLVTDLSMPALDGIALIREARIRRRHLPAVLLTGYAGPGTMRAISGLLEGGVKLVRKPVTATQLGSEIEALRSLPMVG